jgi:cyclic pyranopterin monophosphate synthase
MTLTHMDDEGRARMVDVGDKPVTTRTAVAGGFVRMAAATVQAVREHRTPKGDPLEVARLAGIMAAKRTAELIPLCHPLPLTHADVRLDLRDGGVQITATARTDGKTGVEMEALTAAAVAALTLYDMCKAMDKAMEITDIRLESKTGGRSGDYNREAISDEREGGSQASARPESE